MKNLLTTLFLAICCGGTNAQTAINQESIVSGTQQETNLFQPQADSLQKLLTVNNLAQDREDQRLRTRLTYPKMLDGFTNSVKSQSGSYTLAEPQPDASSNYYYKPLQDMSWVGVPIFVAGIIAKGEKKAFRQDYKNSPAKTRLVTEFKTRIDDYLQFFSPAMTLGLKVGGVESRSDWQRLGVSAALSYGIMAGFVNGIKYTATEMRPDGSTANSWPSGHTATAFVGATILHKEYGLTKSPWYSVVGYGAATATGIMRVLNNRHWVSDVLSGAGIGIMSGELGYLLSDIIYKGRHLLNSPLNSYPDLSRKHPSFFDVSMGIGFGSKELNFSNDDVLLTDDKAIKLKFRSATVVQAEGAYFLNTYVGVGGRLRVRSSPINGWNNFMKISENEIQDVIDGLKEIDRKPGDNDGFVIDGKISDMIEEKEISIKSDHLTEFAGDVGLYFNFPINNRLALGSKLLSGRSVMQALEIDARFKGQSKGFDYDLSVRNGEIYDIVNMRFYDKNESYDEEWAFATVSGDNSTKWGTGISLTYAYNGNFCWKVFCDYDFTKKTYTLEYDPEHYTFKACPDLIMLNNVFGSSVEPIVVKTKKNMSQFVLGASFSIQF